MINTSKFALIAALAAVSVASPVRAQSFDPRVGTGNELPLQYEADGGRNNWVAPSQSNFAAVAHNFGKVAVRQSKSYKIATHGHGHHAYASARHGFYD